jgi:signal transduction histidine kinase/BarA-like signal transduction histidine kinase
VSKNKIRELFKNKTIRTVGAIALMVLFAFWFIIARHSDFGDIILLVSLVSIGLIVLSILMEEQQEQKNELRFQNERMEWMLSMSPGLVVENVEDSTKIYVAGSAAALFGLSSGYIEKEEFLGIIHPSDFLCYSLAYGKVADNSITDWRISSDRVSNDKEENAKPLREEIRLRYLNGSYIWMECLFTVLAPAVKQREGSQRDGLAEESGGGRRRIIVTFQDIDRRKRESQERGNIIQSLGKQYSTMLLVNLEQDTYEVMKDERALERKLPESGIYSRANMIFFGMRVVPEIRNDITAQLAIENIKGLISSATPVVEVEYQRKTPKGKEKWERVTIVEVSETAGVVTEVVMAINDITEQKKVEINNLQIVQEAMEAANSANNAKSDFLSRMSHDIRTPLNAIIGMAGIARKNMTDSERLKDCLSKIDVSSDHLLNLVNEVLDMSRIESGRITLFEEELDLSELIQNVRVIVENLALSREHTFTVETKGVVHPAVIGDASRIRQIMANLLSNAVKYTPQGGRIRFTVHEVEGTEAEGIEVEETEVGGRLGNYVFVIEDNGVGMTAEFLQEIYEPFSRVDDSRTSKIEGTGLGMAIVHNLVRMMKGTIEVESTIGEGTRFIVTLPLKRQDETAVQQRQGQEFVTDFTGKRVLMVEDNELNMEISSDLLATVGVTVETAENGLEAVEKVVRSTEFYYDIIFMDIQMPLMNGYEATMKIRSLKRADALALPIIALTANAFAEDILKAKEAGMNDHVSKPIALDRLVTIMNDWIIHH